MDQGGSLSVALAGDHAEDEVVEILRQTMPLQVVGVDLLRKIAAAGRRVTCEERTVIYEVDDVADDLYILVSGEIRHTLGPGAHAKEPTKVLKKGDVFGWAALLDKSPRRLARAVCHRADRDRAHQRRSAVRMLEAEPEAGDVVMSRFATMITRDYTVPDLIVELRAIHRKMHARDDRKA